MALREEVSKILAEDREARLAGETFLRLEKFYESMKSRGLIRPETYTLPPLDTIGHGSRGQIESIQQGRDLKASR